MKKINCFYPTLGLSWATVGIFLGASVMVSIFLAVFIFIVPEEIFGSWPTLVGYLLPFVFTGGFIYLLRRHVPDEPAARAPRRLSVWLFLLLLMFTPLLAIVIEPLTAWLPMPEPMKELFEGTFQLNLPTFLMVVIAAPVCEEWLCRGIIAKGLLRHSTPARAILWSAFIFAVIHMNPWQAVPAFLIGLLLGYVYWKTRSLWPCMFIHFVNNGLSFLLMLLFPDMGADAATWDLIDGISYLPVYGVALLLALGIGYLLYRKLNASPTAETVMPV
jgi:membrane protease YdiL (CAAX protease family)